MSVAQLAALARRHLFAVCLILLVAAGIAVDVKHMQPGFDETATVALEPQSFEKVEPLNPDQDFSLNSTLITTCQLLAMRLSGPQGAIQFHQAGVTGKVTISVVNESNADTPMYSYPDLLVSVVGDNPDITHQEFTEVIQVISADVADFQAGNHISAQSRLVTYTLSDSGPISLRGSLVRTYAALIFLTSVAIFLTCRVLDWRSRAALASRRIMSRA